LFWALYPNIFEQMPYTLPEIFACSLIPLFLFCTLNGFKSNTSKKALKYLIISGLIFGYLALTKPIFGYVLTFVMVLSFFIWLTNRKSANYKKTIVIFVVGFITTLPYLAYTYNLTGKVFYWSSFGGNNLYWMSSPFKEEYGDYYRYPFTNHYNDRIPESIGLIKLNHEKDFLLLSNDPEVRKANTINGVLHEDFSIGTKQDELLKQIALENITSHPLKFLQNCISNAGRILFNYPGSYVLQKPSTLRRLPVNGTLIVLCVFCFIPTLLNWKKIIFPIRLLLFLSSVYLGASLLGSAEPRMFTMIVPILLFWIAYMLQRTVKVKLKFSAE
jgi:4-amino-4-deoxy-L-arabinose transferase-like glycosyltransferase